MIRKEECLSRKINKNEKEIIKNIIKKEYNEKENNKIALVKKCCYLLRIEFGVVY